MSSGRDGGLPTDQFLTDPEACSFQPNDLLCKAGDAEAAQFGELMQALPKPVLAYCRTGTRAATL